MNYRTALSGSVSYQSFKYTSEIEGIDDDDMKMGEFNLSASCTYYISPRFSANGSIEHYNRSTNDNLNDEEETYKQTRFNVSLSYDIF